MSFVIHIPDTRLVLRLYFLFPLFWFGNSRFPNRDGCWDIVIMSADIKRISNWVCVSSRSPLQFSYISILWYCRISEKQYLYDLWWLLSEWQICVLWMLMCQKQSGWKVCLQFQWKNLNCCCIISNHVLKLWYDRVLFINIIVKASLLCLELSFSIIAITWLMILYSILCNNSKLITVFFTASPEINKSNFLRHMRFKKGHRSFEIHNYNI